MAAVIKIRGARENNLKNIDLDIPKNKLVVLTGVSGSGKSSLAFNTIYAEGQRRYVESLSSYARQFLDMQKKPDVDLIEGLAPAISIEQKTTSKNPRSTVGTVTEIYDYLRLLWARVGVPHSPVTGLPIKSQTIGEMVDWTMKIPTGVKIFIMAPLVRERKGEYKKEIAFLVKQGYQRAIIDGELYDLSAWCRGRFWCGGWIQTKIYYIHRTMRVQSVGLPCQRLNRVCFLLMRRWVRVHRVMVWACN